MLVRQPPMQAPLYDGVMTNTELDARDELYRDAIGAARALARKQRRFTVDRINNTWAVQWCVTLRLI